MPAVLDAHPCPACKRPHTLFLPHCDAPDPDGKYVYHCAALGISIRLTGKGEWKPANVKPPGAVDLHEMK